MLMRHPANLILRLGNLLLCLPTLLTLVCGRQSNHPAFGPPASISLHLAINYITPAGSVHKSRGDSVVRMWVQFAKMVRVVCVDVAEGA